MFLSTQSVSRPKRDSIYSFLRHLVPLGCIKKPYFVKKPICEKPSFSKKSTQGWGMISFRQNIGMFDWLCTQTYALLGPRKICHFNFPRKTLTIWKLLEWKTWVLDNLDVDDWFPPGLNSSDGLKRAKSGKIQRTQQLSQDSAFSSSLDRWHQSKKSSHLRSQPSSVIFSKHHLWQEAQKFNPPSKKDAARVNGATNFPRLVVRKWSRIRKRNRAFFARQSSIIGELSSQQLIVRRAIDAPSNIHRYLTDGQKVCEKWSGGQNFLLWQRRKKDISQKEKNCNQLPDL